ncbi:hypothetical protein [Pseudomonas panipatensis]|uniref:Thioredoxin n=1 Tax=Pseudomonas panipatensis TaxID=428992 RepID=A0A1G8F939_9PSED|nr:hypothetical protein [Pseudomonas panipatensis]SDH78666.1 hypothetical protein SAMN05216272_10399 [Pseudomonas panipatensis]SMP54953.1 hypothetical protein SAMN06295951_103360 [Pseudomonas panipatensis]
MRITLVKKVLADGQDCRKCKDVYRRLEKGGYLGRIDRILVADERNPSSAGWMAAAHYGVDTAPFFIVRHDDGHEQVYTLFMSFLHEILEGRGPAPADSPEALAELAQRDDLDRL